MALAYGFADQKLTVDGATVSEMLADRAREAS
jgi:hypothetical protein